MIRLEQKIPSPEFQAGPNMKLYPTALQDELFDLLDQDIVSNMSINTIFENMETTNNIIFVRHLESKYNEYKNKVIKTGNYKKFQEATNQEEKLKVAEQLLWEFFQEVWIDYATDISEEGKKQGEELGRNYAKLIAEKPALFPTRIYVSPYLRTKKTCHYMLKYVEWLDLDIDILIDPDNMMDMVIGKFQWKEVILKMDDRIRERDHGKNIAPTFLKKTIEWNNLENFGAEKLPYMQKQQLWYYTNPAWWESQVEVSQRIKSFLKSIKLKLMLWEIKEEKDKHNQVLVVSHHLAIIAAVQSVFGWTFNTFFQLDKYWKPNNWSITILSQIPETQSGQKDRIRVWAYNMMLKD